MDRIHNSANTVYFEGNVKDLKRACYLLFQLIKDKGYKDITLDFSRCDKIFEDFMLPLITRINYYKKCEQVDFTLYLPQENRLESLFINTNWAHYINETEFKKSHYADDSFDVVPAYNYKDQAGLNEILKNVEYVLFGKLKGVGIEGFKAVTWGINEIAGNVLGHAKSKIGGFLQVTNHDKKKSIELIVCDAGIGIPESMGITGYGRHTDALQKAIKEGAEGTNNPKKNQGNGLYGAYRMAVLSKGEFEIYSYHGHLSVWEGGDVRVSNERIPYEGTFVKFFINYTYPRLLNEALNFKGQEHKPISLFLEEYETEKEGEMKILMKENYDQTRSREGGKHIRTQIENLLQNNSNKVVIDFEKVNVITSSFADEVFGRLFVEMGPSVYSKRIELCNSDDTIIGLIDRAIEQRFTFANIEKEKNE